MKPQSVAGLSIIHVLRQHDLQLCEPLTVMLGALCLGRIVFCVQSPGRFSSLACSKRALASVISAGGASGVQAAAACRR